MKPEIQMGEQKDLVQGMRKMKKMNLESEMNLGQ